MGIIERFYSRINASFKSDFRKLLNDLLDQGWRIEPTAGKKGHLFAFPPDESKQQVLLPGTPSDHRAWNNMLSNLKRSGYDEQAAEESEEEHRATIDEFTSEPKHHRDYAAEQTKQQDDEMAEILFDEVAAGAPEEDIHQVVDMINDEQIKR